MRGKDRIIAPGATALLAIMLPIALAIMVALGLRLWAIGAEPLWLDEAYSIYAADHGFAFLWQIVPRYETHPPVYYSLLRLWTLAFGNGLLALRSLGALAGVATLPVLVVATRDAARLLAWDDRRTRRAMVAMLAFASVAIPLVEMTRQVRPYPLMILAYAGATAVLLRLARRRVFDGGLFLAYLLLVEAILWLHNLGTLYAVALTAAFFCLLVGRPLSRRAWGFVIGGHGVVALLYLPGLRILLDQTPTWVEATWLRFSLASARGHIVMLYAAPGVAWLAALGLVGIALGAALRRDKGGGADGRRVAAILLLLALLPLCLSILVSAFVAPIFITRTLTPLAAPALILYALGAVALSGRGRWIGIGAAMFLGMAMLGVDIQARRQGNGEAWYPMIAWLAPRFRPGDQIVAYPNEGALPLAYALRDAHLDLPLRPIPRPVPAFDEPGGHYVSGSRGVVSLAPWRVRQIVADPALRAVPTIWLLRLGPEAYDPGDVFRREIAVGRHVVGGFRAGPIDLVGLRRDPVTPPPAPARNRR